jgi:hypothetical protein
LKDSEGRKIKLKVEGIMKRSMEEDQLASLIILEVVNQTTTKPQNSLM